MRALLSRASILASAVFLIAVAPASASSHDTWDTFVDQHRHATDTPGAAFAVVGPQGIEHVGTFGTDGDGNAVTDSTPFLWGSVSKPVAATLVIGLVRGGALGLDDRVVDHLPDFRTADSAASARITVRELLDHTSGLPPALQITDRDDPRRTPSDAISELSGVALLGDPGSKHYYSSANYLVLSAVVEQVTDRPYADVLTDRLLAPLGMNDAITSGVDLPAGHRYVAGHSVAFDSPYDAAGLGYGYLDGSIGDLARFARAQLGGVPTIVPPADLLAMQTAQISVASGGSYGLGWRQNTLSDFDIDSDAPIVWHSGAAPGYQSALILLPSQQRALVVLQNSYGFFQENALLDAATGLAALVVGADPAPMPGAPWSYPAILIALALVIAAFATVALRATRAPINRLASIGWAVVCAGSVYALAVLVPGAAGLTLGQFPLWAPDIGWLTMIAIATAGLAGIWRVVVAVRAGGATPVA